MAVPPPPAVAADARPAPALPKLSERLLAQGMEKIRRNQGDDVTQGLLDVERSRAAARIELWLLRLDAEAPPGMPAPGRGDELPPG